MPDKHQCDTLYAKPAVYVMKMVKDEKVYRAETREVLTGKKYWMSKETIEDMAFGDGGGSIWGDVFFSRWGFFPHGIDQ